MLKAPPSTPEEMAAPPKHGVFSSIHGRLVILILLVLVPLLISQAFFSYERYKHRRAVEIQANLELARAIAKSFETFVYDVVHSELIVGLAFSGSRPLTDEDRDRMLNMFQADNPAIRSAFWIDRAGRIVASSLRSYIGFDISDRSFFQDVAAGKDWSISELIIGKATGSPAFTISRGIRDEKGELRGIVAASIEPDRMDGILGVDRSKSGAVTLVDNKGMMVYRYPHVSWTWEKRNQLRQYPVYAEAHKGKEVGNVYRVDWEAGSRISALSPIPSIGWVAGAGRGEEEALGPVTSTIFQEVGVILLVALASFLGAFGLSRTISISVKTLRKHALALGRGEPDTSVITSGPAELRDLADVFGMMAERVRARESDLRQNEEILGRSEQKYRELVQNANSAIIRWKSDGSITFFNEYAQAFFGYREDEVIGRHAAILLPEKESNGKDLTTLVRDIVIHPERYIQNINENVRRDGSKVWMAWTNRPILDESGNVVEILAVGTDMTERKRAEDAVKIHLAVMETVAEGIFLVGVDDNIIKWTNRKFEEMFGYDSGEMVGMHVDKVNAPTDRTPTETRVSIVDRLLREKEWHGEIENIRKDGTRFWCFIHISLLDHPEFGRVMVSAHTDITSLKNMAEEIRKSRDELEVRVRERTAELEAYMKKLRESNEALQDFASIASHDLQEPLRKVSSFGNMLQRKYADALGEEGKDFLGRMINATERMQTLLQALLEYSRVTSRAKPFEVVELSALVKEVLVDLEIRIQESGGEVAVGELPSIEADPTQMRQLFQNLIGNALKFHEEGRKPIVRIRFCDRGPEGYEITVEDNGIGFDEKYLDRIFAPFQRLHGKSAYEGTGMGLAICRKIVERHGGNLSARSSPGAGSVFIVRLPGSQRS